MSTQVLEWDSLHTWSGLPAPQGWHITEFIHAYHQPDERCGFAWERLTGGRLSVMEDVSVMNHPLESGGLQQPERGSASRT